MFQIFRKYISGFTGGIPHPSHICLDSSIYLAKYLRSCLAFPLLLQKTDPRRNRTHDRTTQTNINLYRYANRSCLNHL